MSQIQIANIPDRNGQILRNALVDRLHTHAAPADPRYRLEITQLREKIRDLDVTIRSDTTRRQMKVTATLRLIDIASGKAILDKKMTAAGSYNVLQNEYNTRASRQDVRTDLLTKLALQAERYISIRLLTPHE